MAGKLEAFAKKQGIKYFLFNFTDLRGVQRSKLVPASAAPAMEKSGAGFAGFAAYLDMTPAYPDMFAVPDPSSLMQLPWKPEVAWVAGDLVMEGAPVAQAPRVVLKRLLNAALKKGLRLKTGVEAEYHLIDHSRRVFEVSSLGKAVAGPPPQWQQRLQKLIIPAMNPESV